MFSGAYTEVSWLRVTGLDYTEKTLENQKSGMMVTHRHIETGHQVNLLRLENGSFTRRTDSKVSGRASVTTVARNLLVTYFANLLNILDVFHQTS